MNGIKINGLNSNVNTYNHSRKSTAPALPVKNGYADNISFQGMLNPYHLAEKTITFLRKGAVGRDKSALRTYIKNNNEIKYYKFVCQVIGGEIRMADPNGRFKEYKSFTDIGKVLFDTVQTENGQLKLAKIYLENLPKMKALKLNSVFPNQGDFIDVAEKFVILIGNPKIEAPEAVAFRSRFSGKNSMWNYLLDNFKSPEDIIQGFSVEAKETSNALLSALNEALNSSDETILNNAVEAVFPTFSQNSSRFRVIPVNPTSV